ncbi:MAG: hypothetical protein ACRYF5_15390 [Janthinobacterium lividum]
MQTVQTGFERNANQQLNRRMKTAMKKAAPRDKERLFAVRVPA